MKHALLLVIFLTLAACDQRVSGPLPTPAAGATDGKKTGNTNMADKTEKSNAGKTAPPANPDNKVAKADDKTETPATIDRIELSEEEWKKKLTAEEYYVLRKKGTERAFTGKYDKFYKKGKYVCAACGLELFTSDTKFDSGCGWPAFYAAKAGDRVKLTEDLSFGSVRTEVTCARCDGHLGHIFDDAPQTPTGQRYCINSVSIKFVPSEGPLRENIAQDETK
jgi:peptide-methionine (R)-S-oxide reductase